ncbi:enoyl-CoA hydratase/isomerase family protein [Mycolicibacterium flavescens]|uniref:Enoyl-CoA hydratase n=1 Tax=Mycolicibacterium flavescens TaxID=1776 RepID=A0A1E3RDJ2_MYCFV|nr:enoyl-CoA hydratase-related protein [Mycolicibacterium flavescens]MCV7282416.1 enoyl-CoA hydratase/isomerase family protein [Mycolicibacterium flavescens]ODQ87936.1 enoyl-CoA hydratase [Mycolicibacterium flavescens]
MSEVVYETDGQGVALLTLSRPERRNMWTAQMEAEFYDSLDRAAADPDARVVVVTGAGNSFVPGLDPQVLAGLTTGAAYTSNRRPQTYASTIPKPVVGAINGACAGIGLAQALMFDYRFAVRGAKFSTAFAKRGLPAEDATAWTLTRLCGPAHAFELLASGRVFLAEEAVQLGVVQHLSEPGEVLDDALAFARGLAANVSPVAMAMIKSQVWRDSESTLEAARIRAQYLLKIAKEQPDFAEGTASLTEKRPPAFPPYPGLNL